MSDGKYLKPSKLKFLFGTMPLEELWGGDRPRTHSPSILQLKVIAEGVW